MNYKIIQKEAFRFVGVSKRVSLQFEGVNNEIIQLASEITEEKKESCINYKIWNHMKL